MPVEDHMAATGKPCDIRDPDGNCPHDADFWWNCHIHNAARFNLEPFRRNPSDIDEALHLEEGRHSIWLEAWDQAIKFEEFGVQTVVEAFTRKYIAGLMDAGILVRP